MKINRKKQKVSRFIVGLLMLSYTSAMAQKPDLKIQTGHVGKVISIAFSPDSRWLATGSWDTTAKLWDVASGRELYTYAGHESSVSAVVFSPNGRWLVSGDIYSKIKLWDISTGYLLRNLSGHKSIRWRGINTLSFHPNGEIFASGGADKKVKIWRFSSGQELKTLKGHSEIITSVAFSPDGRRLVTGGATKIIIWETSKWRKLRTFQKVTAPLAFSPDGSLLATEGHENTIKLSNLATGNVIRTLTGHVRSVNSLSFSPDGRRLASGSGDQIIKIWETDTGEELLSWTGNTTADGVEVVTFSPDGKWLASSSGSDKTVKIWEPASGKLIRTLSGGASDVSAVALDASGHRLAVWAGTGKLWDLSLGQGQDIVAMPTGVVSSVAAFSTNGHWCAYVYPENRIKLLNMVTGRVVDLLKNQDSKIMRIAISPNGESVAAADSNKAVMLWNIKSEHIYRTLTGHSYKVFALAFSPDGGLLATGGGFRDGTIKLWEVRTGRELWNRKADSFWVGALAFSEDGRWLASAGNNKTIKIWDVNTGHILRTLDYKTKAGIEAMLFSPDGQWLASGFIDKTITLWELTSGKQYRSFTGHTSMIKAIRFSRDSHWLVSGSIDCTTRIWDVNSGKELCKLVHFLDGSWAVVDTEGRYDASNGGDLDLLHWIVANEPIALNQLKERYYEPGLLAKLLGYNDEPLRDMKALTDVELYPEIELSEPIHDDPQLKIRLTNRGGGIGRVVVFINGKEITADARGSSADPNAQEMELPPVDIANHPYLIPGESNLIEVKAFNAEGYLASRNVSAIYRPPKVSKIVPLMLWSIVAGVSDYRGEEIDLRFAAKDAVDMAHAIRIGANRLFGTEHTNVTLLTTEKNESAIYPSKKNLFKAFSDVAAKAKSTDILVVYLAGHGVTYGGQDGDYYYLTAEAISGNLKDDGIRRLTAISSEELIEEIKKIPALKQVLILDTCHSGRLGEKLTEERAISSSQIRAYERMKDRIGLHILAGATADAVAYESSSYGQGILTYSLLFGMRGAALRDDEYVDISRLFQYSADCVPELAKNIGGIQSPVVAVPRGGSSFDIGRLQTEDKSLIPLAEVRQLVLRAFLHNDEPPFDDNLGLNKLLNDAFREISARGRNATLVFVDADEFPQAYKLSGRYRVTGRDIMVTVYLLLGQETKGSFQVKGNLENLEKFVADILKETEKQISLFR